MIYGDKSKEKYTEYINRHISNVQKAYNEFGKRLFPLISYDENNVIERIKNHDKSKFSDDEFDAYRKYFYPSDKKELKDSREDGTFLHAWEHHYINNDHHPEFWFDRFTNKSKEMSNEAIIEMICDWIAMSYHFNNNPYEWFMKSEYMSNKPYIKLNPKTQETVIMLLSQPFIKDYKF